MVADREVGVWEGRAAYIAFANVSSEHGGVGSGWMHTSRGS